MALAAIGILAGLVLATLAWYVRVQTYQGVATGGEARIVFASTCDAEAGPVIAARLSGYGLPATPIPVVLGCEASGVILSVTVIVLLFWPPCWMSQELVPLA